MLEILIGGRTLPCLLVKDRPSTAGVRLVFMRVIKSLTESRRSCKILARSPRSKDEKLLGGVGIADAEDRAGFIPAVFILV